MRALAVALFVGGMLAVASLSTAQPPQGGKGEQKKGDGKADKGGKGGFGGKGGPGGFGGFGPAIGQVMPVFVQDQLKLTDEQKKQLEALQKDIDAKLDKLLTDEQRKQLKEMKERGGRPGGPGGFGGGRPGGPGGNPPPKQPE